MKTKNENIQTLKIIPVMVLMALQRSNLKVLFLVKTVQIGNTHCLDPLGGPIIDGRHIGLSHDCRAKKVQLIFPSSGNMISICRNW